MANAILRLGTVFLAGAEGFDWPKVFGGKAPEVELQVTRDVSTELAKLPAIVTLEIRQGRFESGRQFDDVMRRTEVFIQRLDGADEDLDRWILTDSRYWLEELLVSMEFNGQKIGNERLPLAQNVAGNLLGSFRTKPKTFFKPHTLRKRGAQNFEFAGLFDAADQLSEWTAYQALIYLLTQYFEDRLHKVQTPLSRDFRPVVVVESSAVDNGATLANFPTTINWGQATTRLAAKAHVDFFLNDGGEYVVRSLEPVALPSHVGDYEGAGTPLLQDRSRERPRNLRAYFAPENELKLFYIERDTETDLSSLSIVAKVKFMNTFGNCINTIENPNDIFDAVAGRIVRRGEEVEIQRYLRLCEQDTVNPYPNKGSVPVLSMAVVREQVNGLRLKSRYATQGIRTDPLWVERMDAIESGFRRRFMILPDLMAGIDVVKDELVAIINAPDQGRPVSNVWADRTVIFNGIRYAKAGSRRKNQSSTSGISPRSAGQGSIFSPEGWPAINTPAAQTGIRGLPINTTQKTHIRLDLRNPKLGIFELTFLRDQERKVQFDLPGHVEDIPNGAVGALTSNAAKYQTFFKMREGFRMAALVSVVFSTPNNNKRLYALEPKDTGFQIPQPAEGREEELYVSEAFAGLAWDDTTSQLKVEGSDILIEGNRPVNPAYLEDLANSKFRQVYFEYQDRYVGRFKGSGYRGDIDSPQGNFREVSVEYSGDGSLQTVWVGSREEPGLPLEEGLRDQSKRILLRLTKIPEV